LRSVNSLVLILGFLLAGFQNLKRAHEGFVDRHHSASVVKFSAVIWRGEQSDELALGKEFVAIFDNLVGSTNKIEIVTVQEFRHHIGTKSKAHASVILAPALYIFVWIGPEEVAEEARVRDVCGPHDPPDLLHGLEVGAEAAMAAEDLLVDYGRDGEAVEAVGERLPQLDVVATLALVVETVNSVDGGTLMISPEEEEVLRILDLVGQEKADSLQALLASVHIVSEEEVICLGRKPSILEQSEKVCVLSVDVAADLEGRLQLEQDRLLKEDLARLEAQPAHLSLRHLHRLARPTASSHFQQSLDNAV